MLVGRTNEINTLKAAYDSQYSAFVAVTGRRRIGKNNSEFTIAKDYEMNLRNKISRFQLETKSHKTIRLVLITALGLKKNIYSDIVQNVLTINDLFKDL